MKKNKIIKLVIVQLVIIIVITLVIAFSYKKKAYDNLGYIISINDKVNYTTDIDYISEYKNLIVSNNNKNIDYEIMHDDSVLYGKVYIDDSKNINIVDGFSKKEKKVGNGNYETIYRKNVLNDKLIFYALTSDNRVYKFVLDITNIDDIKNYEIKTEKKVKNFVDVSINSISSTEIIPVVLCDDDKMYILGSPILYSEEYYQLFDDFIVFENDLTVTTMDGVILKDTTENPIKLWAFSKLSEPIFAKNKLSEIIKETGHEQLNENPKEILFTDKGELLFLNSKNELFYYNKIVKNLKLGSKLEISFYDDTTLKLDGTLDVIQKYLTNRS